MMIEELVSTAARFVQETEMNVVAELKGLRIYDSPLIKVASASDPMFDVLKQDGGVGPEHRSPVEWLPSAKSVISYFLPFTAEVRRANRYDGDPAMEWLYGRIEGEKLNQALRDYLVGWLKEQGAEAMAPTADPRFAVKARVSNWSERHVAYVTGLGTLSLNCSLITEVGAAGRLGSIVTDAELPVSERLYERKDEYCTHCGACIRRCPADAVTEDGKDHGLCSAFLDGTRVRYAPRYGCGKCQTGVPCEDRAPGKRR